MRVVAAPWASAQGAVAPSTGEPSAPWNPTPEALPDSSTEVTSAPLPRGAARPSCGSVSRRKTSSIRPSDSASLLSSTASPDSGKNTPVPPVVAFPEVVTTADPSPATVPRTLGEVR